MRTLLRHFWNNIRTSFWFVPGLMTGSSIILAYISLEVDRGYGVDLLDMFDWLRTVSADGTRQLLSTVAASVLTLAGLTFSSTLVALTLASSQFGPRLIRNFIRSFGSQFVLGGLLGTFAFCLLILRAVRSVEKGEFIPHLSTLIAFVLTLLSLCLFIYFINYLATSIQAENVVARVYSELKESIDRFFPKNRSNSQSTKRDEEDAEETASDDQNWQSLQEETAIHSPRDGYVVGISRETIVEIATEYKTRFRSLVKPGSFVTEGRQLLAYSSEIEISDEDQSRLAKAYVIHSRLTAEEDFQFCLRQLEEIALRALSPGINDPFTAINCIDYIGAALRRIAGREMPQRFFFDDDGRVRLKAIPIRFHQIVNNSLDQIRQHAIDKPLVALRLFEAMGAVADAVVERSGDSRFICHNQEAVDALITQADMLGKSAMETIQGDADREAIQHEWKRLRHRCGVDEEA